MPTIQVILDGDGAWPELQDRSDLVAIDDETPWRLAVLPAGMSSGAHALALRLDVDFDGPDGPIPFVAQTSLAAWIAATCTLRGRYPEAFRGGPLDPDIVDAVAEMAERIGHAIGHLGASPDTPENRRLLRILSGERGDG